MDGNSAVSGVTPAAGETAGTARRARILGTVRAMMTDLLKTAPSAADDDTPFVELGANSLTHMEMIRTIERAFGIKLALRQFFADLTSIDTLVSYIDGRLPADPASRPAAMPTAPPTAAGRPATAASPRRPVVPRPAPVPAALPTAAGSAGDLEAIFAEQIRAASEAVHRIVARQLDYLRSAGLPAAPGIGALPPAAAAPDRSATETVSAAPAAAPDRSHTETVPVAPAEAAQPGKTVPLPPWKVVEIRARGLTDRHRAHLEALTTRYTRRTARSKELTQANRPVLADNRASAGFRLSTKEMLYPLLGVRSQGARIWDIDGNAYVDITMGFGTYLFGHSPDFVVAALHAQLDQGFQIGPQTALAGEVAWLFRELTGMERVAFFNTGTEAVMSALRLARTVTGRPKIALFEESYHGHFDGTLGAREDAARHRAAPMAPGIIPGAVGELLILDYGDPRSLEVIRAHGDTLAAVLVEPVQSRRPDLQPREFLHDLRRLTGEVGALLVFDEMITGFRIGPGGAQAWFGVAADLATYGKIVGGGLPIGIVTGRAAVMDAVDGGFWSYGDASYPAADTTFFAGTFNKYPLVLAAAKAVLTRLKAEGSALQTALNERTARFADRLNGFFAAEDVPMRLSHFGSQFRLSFSGNMDMLFLHLPEKGVYVWEGRNCFLSTAHTDEDIDHLVGAVAESIEEMRGGGFLPARAGSACRVPTTEAQQQLWLQARLAGDGALAYHVATTVELRGALDAEALRGAVRAVVARHDSLRTVIAGNGDSQRVLPQREAGLPLADFSGVPAERRDAAVDAWFEAQAAAPFDLAAGPLFRAHLLRLEPARHWLVAAGHHIVIDGWSSSVIIDEIARLYTARCEGRAAELDPPPQFEAFVRWQELERRSESMAGHEAFWLERCADAPPALDLPADRPRPPVKTFRGARHSETLDPALCRALAALGTRQGGTLFMTLLAAYLLWLHRVSGQDDLVVGIPVAGRGLAGAERLVGYCTHLLPIRSRYDGARDVAGIWRRCAMRCSMPTTTRTIRSRGCSAGSTCAATRASCPWSRPCSTWTARSPRRSWRGWRSTGCRGRSATPPTISA